MNYLQFREQWLGLGCFSIYQLRAWKSDLDSSSLSRWVKRGYLVFTVGEKGISCQAKAGLVCIQ